SFGSAAGKPVVQPEPRAASGTEWARDRSSGTGAGAGDRFRPDDPHVLGAATAISRIHAAGTDSNIADRDPRIGGERTGARGPAAAGHPGKAAPDSGSFRSRNVQLHDHGQPH